MSKQAVLLVNLGSPDSPSESDVRRYLREFLMDGRVLDAPWPIRFCVVNFGILPSRPKQSAEAYHSIWTPEGSPLIVTSKRVQALLQARVPIPVELAMRYQNPSIPDAVARLAGEKIDDVLLISLFPHYAMSSFETAVERVKEVSRQIGNGMRVQVQPPYFDHPDYIEALVGSAKAHLDRPFDHLLFSFHGIPVRHLRKSDPTGQHCQRVPDCCSTPSPAHETCYRAQCFRTVSAFAKQAGLEPTRYSVAFQSRLGREPWLTPYTDQVLGELPSRGVKRLLVICPAFVSDCLETIEEIGMRGRETFLGAGGESCELIPCLNDHPLWIQALEGMASKFISSQQGRG